MICKARILGTNKTAIGYYVLEDYIDFKVHKLILEAGKYDIKETIDYDTLEVSMDGENFYSKEMIEFTMKGLL